MGLRSTCSDYLIAELARQRQIRKPIAMHVAHLLPTVAVLGASEAVWTASTPGHDMTASRINSPARVIACCSEPTDARYLVQLCHGVVPPVAGEAPDQAKGA